MRFTRTGIVSCPLFLFMALSNAYRSCHDALRAQLICSFTGTCSLGPRCSYSHDPSKVAICSEFLKSGRCARDQHCDLSHELTYERVPACVHFLRGFCSKESCRYPHVRANPAAAVCRAFSNLGFCSRGISCNERHVFECPDYSNKGNCPNPICRLPHVDRAGQLRHHDADETSCERSDGGIDGDKSNTKEEIAEIHSDVDSEDLNDTLMFDSGDPEDQPLAGQHDFVHF